MSWSRRKGQWDEEALAGALRRDARYVGLVASPTRAAAVRTWLREETGLAEERLAALRAPAGMDIGAETAEEVALSILAELIQVRRGRPTSSRHPVRPRSPGKESRSPLGRSRPFPTTSSWWTRSAA